MSTTVSPNESPASVQPLHNPSQAAYIVVPQAPLGNANTNAANANAPGMGVKALLAKKMAKSHNPTYISPTDNLMTPCTQKLNAQKQKHFTKGAKPVNLFGQREDVVESRPFEETKAPKESNDKMDEDENPF